MKYAWLVIAVFFARFLVTAVAYPKLDGDLGWQRWLGATILRTHAIPRALGNETFSAPGAMWVPQEWAFGIAASLGRSGFGWVLFAGTVAVCAAAALAFTAYRAERRGASPLAVALVTTAAGLGLFESFGVRAQVAAWPMLALFLLLIDLESPWMWAAVAVAALWSNLHASAALAPILAALYAAGAALDERGAGPRTRKMLALTAACCIAVCCNPFGWHLPAYALSLFASPIKAQITEWQVTTIDDSSFLLGSLPLIFLAAYCGTRTTRRWADGLVFAAFVVLVLGAARNIALFGLATGPIVALALSRTVAWFARDETPAPRDPRAAWMLPAFSVVLAVVVAGVLFGSSNRVDEKPVAPAIVALERMPGAHRVFCADFAWCSFLIGVPRERVYLDGRADPYPPAVWDDFATIVRLRPGWDERLAAHRVNVVLVERDAPLDQALQLTPAWQPRFEDKHYRVYVRDAGVALSGVGSHAGDQAQRGPQFARALRVISRLPGVPGVGVVLR